MSSMLEQAIIDAEALKEAALKNAEQAIIEKYSEEVKSAVDNLLEQDDPALEEEVVEEDHEELPYKHRTIEEDDNEITIDLRQLEEQIEQLYGELSPKEESMVLVSEDKEIDEEIDLEITEDEEIVEGTKPDEALSPEREAAEAMQGGSEEAEYEGEEAVTSEDVVRQAVEEALRLDYETVPTGHAGAFTNQEWEYAEEMNKVKDKVAELEEKNDKQRKLMEQALQVINSLEDQTSNYENTVNELKQKLVETNLTNARLYYTNQVLANPSLNERQKDKLVEALTQADSPKQAKTIFETLQSAVGGSSKRSPKSLGEAVERRSLLTVSPKRKQKRDNIDKQITTKWQRLAGIK